MSDKEIRDRVVIEVVTVADYNITLKSQEYHVSIAGRDTFRQSVVR